MYEDKLEIFYEAIHPNTNKTTIVFYQSIEQSLQALFANEVINGIDNKPVTLNTPDLRRVFVTDTNIYERAPVKKFIHNLDTNKHSVIILPAGEEHKTIESVLKIAKTALEHSHMRNSIFTGIGGGVICDITAFAASVFKRGAKLELVPTTLLAMVDAAIGGKTGCDFSSWKNMLGTFYPAQKLYYCIDFVQSLTQKEYRSGLGEVVKTGMLYGPKLFQIMKDEKEKVLSRDNDIVYQIIKRCSLAKIGIVQRDLMEKGPRMELNLGHTFAHAYESYAGFGNVPHGDAVAWGLGRAIDLSLQLGYCTQEYYDDVFYCLKNYGWSTDKIPKFVLNNTKSNKVIANTMLEIMHKDKKNTGEKIRLVLQKDMNMTVIEEVDDSQIIKALL
ncbi:MAG TPA: 3-dehydroquinate synthase family protein [Treponemataceae bacterium]|nr:3-dehydroquinate synthase family protein [Treponemataceae bacterium]